MVNKLIFSILFLLMLLGVAIYFRSEFKYSTMARSHAMGLNSKMKEAGNAEAIVDTMEQNKGIVFATDFVQGEKQLAKLCKPDCLNAPEYYAAYGRLVESIHPEKLWAYKNLFKDKVTTFIFQKEKQKLSDELFKNRMYFSDNYKSVKSDQQKGILLELVKKIDLKITELKK